LIASYFKNTLLFVCIFFSVSISAVQEFDLDVLATNLRNSPQAQGTNLIDSKTRLTYQTLSRDYIFKIDKIRKNISRVSGFHPKFLITSDSNINAYATWYHGQPVIGITLGMLNRIKTDYDALAAVIGHEYAHLTLAHHQSSQTSSAIVDILATIALVAIDVSYGGSNRNTYRSIYKKGLNTASNLAKTKISRNDEIEADLKGLEYMVAAGYSPEGAKRFHASLDASSGFFSSHPSSETRIAKIDEAIVNHKSPNTKRYNYSNNKTAYTKKNKPLTSRAKKQKSLIELEGAENANQACAKKGYKKNSSQYFACIFKYKRLIRQSNKIAKKTKSISDKDNPNLPRKGQVGMVVLVNSEKNIAIFSQSILDRIPNGTSLIIVNEDESLKYEAQSTGYYDGFYSAKLIDSKQIEQGYRVLINTHKITLSALKLLDLNKDGKLSFKEIDQDKVFIDEAEFNKIDSNQDGFLNYAEAEDINIFIRSV